MTKLEVRNVRFGYGDTEILRGIDLTLDGAGLICIIGPNGVGKTTIVKCMCNLLPGVSGKISLDGKDVFTMSRKDLARKVAFVPNSEDSVF